MEAGNLTNDNQFITIIFPDRTVVKCKKLVYSAGDVSAKEGEWEHGSYGEFDIKDVVHVLQQQQEMMVMASEDLLKQQGLTMEDVIKMAQGLE